MADSDKQVVSGGAGGEASTPKKRKRRLRFKKKNEPGQNNQESDQPTEHTPVQKTGFNTNTNFPKGNPKTNEQDKTDAKVAAQKPIQTAKPSPKHVKEMPNPKYVSEENKAFYENTPQTRPQPKQQNKKYPNQYRGNKPPNRQRNPAVPNQESQPAGAAGPELSQQDREKEEKKWLLELSRRRLAQERANRWLVYFLGKPYEVLKLERNKILRLDKVLENKPHAQFVCKLCNYFCDNISVVSAHIHKIAHREALQAYNSEMTIRELPDLTKEQLAVLNQYLLRVVECESLSPADLESRRTIGVLVSDLVSSKLEGCTTRLFGSSIHGLGLKTADVNIDLQVPKGSQPPTMLEQVAGLLSSSEHFENVKENFNSEFPSVSFTFKENKKECWLSLNNERAVRLALMLSKYTPLDPRLIQLSTLFRLWGQLTDIDKPQEGTWPGAVFYMMTIFYLQNLDEPILPVLSDLLPKKEESSEANATKVLTLNVSDIKSQWKTKNTQNLASLWIGLLKFYSVDFNAAINIDSSEIEIKKSKRFFIVDPFLPTRNVGRNVTSNAVSFYIHKCLQETCRYFSIPQTNQGPLFREIYTPFGEYDERVQQRIDVHEDINSKILEMVMLYDPIFSRNQSDALDKKRFLSYDVLHLMKAHKFSNIDRLPVGWLEHSHTYQHSNTNPVIRDYCDMSVSARDARLLVKNLTPDVLKYDFSEYNCTRGKTLPLVCTVCKQEGHMKESCPEENLPPLNVLVPKTPEELNVLDSFCKNICQKWKQSDKDLEVREMICSELQSFIGDHYPTAQLTLFGSTKNGFGLKGSDMDICLVFSDNKTGEGFDTRSFIEVLYKDLKKFKGVRNLRAIATAKVPIVKFTHRLTKLDGDISLYNVLAMENSRLLSTYATIDNRAKILGYVMKRFSKVCDIGDASKGSLSSYAYTLLVIFFLQRCEPPVLPVLQELSEDIEPPKINVENCNVYFFDDLKKLDKVWSGEGLNKQSVGQLWLDLLVFYTEKFDMLNHVVSIRCARPVTKFEKLWISKGIAIEDPFDLSHNLGSALTRKMSLYIIKAFRNGRNHFGQPLNLGALPKNLEEYYLNEKALTDGEPPNDRGCRLCKSIGHKIKDCPDRRKRTPRNQNRRREEPLKKESTGKKPQIDEDAFEEDYEEDEDLEDESDSELSELEDLLMETLQVSERRPNQASKKTSAHEGNKNHSNERIHQPVIQLIKKPHQNPPPGFMGNPARMDVIVHPARRVANVYPHERPERAAIIPSVVFSNSKHVMRPHPPPILQQPPGPINFFPPGTEHIRPPPGFVSLPQNGQNMPFPYIALEEKGMRQAGWAEGAPFVKAGAPGAGDYIRGMPVYGSPAMGSTPRPPVGPPFNSSRFPVVGPTHRLIWSQSPPGMPSSTTFRPMMDTLVGSLPPSHVLPEQGQLPPSPDSKESV